MYTIFFYFACIDDNVKCRQATLCFFTLIYVMKQQFIIITLHKKENTVYMTKAVYIFVHLMQLFFIL